MTLLQSHPLVNDKPNSKAKAIWLPHNQGLNENQIYISMNVFTTNASPAQAVVKSHAHCPHGNRKYAITLIF